MTHPLLKEIRKLPRNERIELVQDIWDSIAEEAEDAGEVPDLGAAQRQELEERIKELDEHPDRARSWEEVRKRLLGRKRG
jgi:putative addiction module component (TIGR02574 family)